MRCRTARQWMGGGRLEGLPEAVAAHLAECAECRRFYERLRELTNLIGLKRYERPQPEAVQRACAAIHQQLVEEACRETEGERVREAPVWIGLALRYALATTVLALLAVHVLTPRVSPVLSDLPPPQELPRMARAPEPHWVRPLVLTGAPLPPDEPWFHSASNVGPPNIQYGPARSVLTRFGE